MHVFASQKSRFSSEGRSNRSPHTSNSVTDSSLWIHHLLTNSFPVYMDDISTQQMPVDIFKPPNRHTPTGPTSRWRFPAKPLDQKAEGNVNLVPTLTWALQPPAHLNLICSGLQAGSSLSSLWFTLTAGGKNSEKISKAMRPYFKMHLFFPFFFFVNSILKRTSGRSSHHKQVSVMTAR